MSARPDTERTPAEREAGARRLCRRLAEDVRRVAPAGIGSGRPEWEPAWREVAAVSDRFLDQLNAWEQTGYPDLLPELRVRYFAVVEAYRAAAAAPVLEEAGHA